MPTFTLYNTQGETVGTVEQPEIFQIPVDVPLIHRYFVWVRSMLRPSIAHTKTRGEVSGGGRKPWKQKGTGRARIGSTRAPHWRHGGVVFGPTPERNWETRMPRGERRKALLSALSSKAQADQVIILDSWTMNTPKTKAAEALLKAVQPLQNKKVLHIHGSFDEALFASTRNLQGFNSKTVQAFNIIDLLGADRLLLTRESLDRLNEQFSGNV